MREPDADLSRAQAKVALHRLLHRAGGGGGRLRVGFGGGGHGGGRRHGQCRDEQRRAGEGGKSHGPAFLETGGENALRTSALEQKTSEVFVRALSPWRHQSRSIVTGPSRHSRWFLYRWRPTRA